MRLGDGANAAGFSLVSLQSVDSTNRLALDLAVQAGANRTWVISEVQRAGRGRDGRDWVSPSGNLYASLLLVAPCATADTPKLGFVAGVALAETVRALLPGEDIRLKWPNDLVVGGAKLAGMLLEGRDIGGGRMAVAIGIGLNIAEAPALPDRPTTSLAALGSHSDRREVLRDLSDRMAERLRVFAGGAGFFAIREAWNGLSLPRGTAMGVRMGGGLVEGRFGGIDGEGRLSLETAAGLVQISAGDVFLTGGQGN